MLEQLEVNTLETAHLFWAGGDACFCSEQHIFTTQPKVAVSNGLLWPVHSYCYFYYCLPYSFHFSYQGRERKRVRASEQHRSLQVYSFPKRGGKWGAHILRSTHFIISHEPSLVFVFFSQTDRFCWMPEETHKGLSTDRTIIQVGQLHNNFSSIHHCVSVACCLVQPLGIVGILGYSEMADLRICYERKKQQRRGWKSSNETA